MKTLLGTAGLDFSLLLLWTSGQSQGSETQRWHWEYRAWCAWDSTDTAATVAPTLSCRIRVTPTGSLPWGWGCVPERIQPHPCRVTVPPGMLCAFPTLEGSVSLEQHQQRQLGRSTRGLCWGQGCDPELLSSHSHPQGFTGIQHLLLTQHHTDPQLPCVIVPRRAGPTRWSLTAECMKSLSVLREVFYLSTLLWNSRCSSQMATCLLSPLLILSCVLLFDLRYQSFTWHHLTLSLRCRMINNGL